MTYHSKEGPCIPEPQIDEFGQRVFQQFMDLFVVPEVQRRQKAGELSKPFILRAAQIIFFPDGRPPRVRVNEEVKAVGEVKLKKGTKKAKGAPIMSSEIEGVEKLTLDDPEYANCGHATLLQISDSWSVVFDFRYNKALSQEHLDTAQEFIDAAEFSLSNKKWAATIDNLFSACELTARAVLLGLPDKRFAQKATHNAIHRRFNRFASIGNIDLEHLSAFNELRKLRDHARYLKAEVRIDSESALQFLAAVKGMHEFARNRLP